MMIGQVYDSQLIKVDIVTTLPIYLTVHHTIIIRCTQSICRALKDFESKSHKLGIINNVEMTRPTVIITKAGQQEKLVYGLL